MRALQGKGRRDGGLTYTGSRRSRRMPFVCGCMIFLYSACAKPLELIPGSLYAAL